METRIQFRIDEETKRLAQLRAEHQGRTLSDACRELAERLADEQRKEMSHDHWLATQVNAAFAKLESGQSSFIDHESANKQMNAFKRKLQDQG
ncbi:damage-inducible protein J [Pseudidiomarina aestuarii]|uniref:damage-inducible protein J n=1 Tax=Pseudidiomarina aestuarii TaxID=624146 RepID=UPI003A96DFFC